MRRENQREVLWRGFAPTRSSSDSGPARGPSAPGRRTGRHDRAESPVTSESRSRINVVNRRALRRIGRSSALHHGATAQVRGGPMPERHQPITSTAPIVERAPTPASSWPRPPSRWPAERSSPSHRPPRRRCRSRSPASTAAATTSPTRPGARPAGRTCGSDRPATPTASAPPVAGPEQPLRQQPDLQRHQPEPVLRAPRHPVGLRLGSVPRPHLRAASGARRRRLPTRARRTSRSTRPTRWRSSPTPLGIIPFTRSSITAGTGRRRNAAPAGQHRQLVPRRVRRLRRHQLAAGLAARRLVRRQPGQQQRPPAPAQQLPAAPRRPRQRGHRAADGRRRPPAGQPDPGRGRR